MKVSDVIAGKRIDLNVDIGEGFPHDKDLLAFATSANICCGAHAGSFDLTRETVELCREHGVRVGVHPGYPDRETMGRKPIEADNERAYLGSIFEQLRRFMAECDPAYMKPHGAFYNDTALTLPKGWETKVITHRGATPYEMAGAYLAQYPGVQSLAMLLRMHHLPLMGLETTAHKVLAQRAKVLFFREGFADRAYNEDGTLVPRWEPGAVLTEAEEIRAQVLRLAPSVDSICLHGDTPDCLEFAELVFKTLVDNGYEVGAP